MPQTHTSMLGSHVEVIPVLIRARCTEHMELDVWRAVDIVTGLGVSERRAFKAVGGKWPSLQEDVALMMCMYKCRRSEHGRVGLHPADHSLTSRLAIVLDFFSE